jgi:hypothetical protein
MDGGVLEKLLVVRQGRLQPALKGKLQEEIR